jgi:hypothetical protein
VLAEGHPADERIRDSFGIQPRRRTADGLVQASLFHEVGSRLAEGEIE